MRGGRLSASVRNEIQRAAIILAGAYEGSPANATA
jgi:hypothetical protein